MGKIYVQNLGLFVTERCNLNCDHCCRGGSCNKNVSDEVIEKTLEQIKVIGTLSICGGEPTLAVDRIEKIFSYIIEHRILLDEVFVNTNGTIYSEELIRLFNEMECYIEKFNKYKKKKSCLLGISTDGFHAYEMEKHGLYEQFKENYLKYKSSGYFFDKIQIIFPLFREGNATRLAEDLTIPLPLLGFFMTYVNNKKKFDRENGFCNIGPLVAVNVDGIVTECDGSWMNMKTIYNYGNVLDDSIENIVLDNNALVLKPKAWNRRVNKEIKRYLNSK